MNPARAAILLLLPMVLAAAAQTPVRVACVGDSITYGDKLADPASQAYPAVLGRLAQGRCVVGNFGVNGATALPIPFRAWADTPAARAALAFDPDLVVVLLGINDFLGFSDQLDRYPAALRGIAARFQALPSAPRLFLCTLLPPAPEDQMAEANRLIREKMNSAVRAVAAETGATVVDLHAVYPAQLDWLPDALHPTPAGAELVARTVLAALDPSAPAPPPRILPAPVAGPVDLSIRNEAFAARRRANPWLEKRGAPADLPNPAPAADVADLLPLLAGAPAPAGQDLYAACAALAAALDRAGTETVFLPDGRSVAWREALLHRLVQSQRIDPQGDGYWTDPAAPDPAAAAPRATAAALRDLALALGE